MLHQERAWLRRDAHVPSGIFRQLLLHLEHSRWAAGVRDATATVLDDGLECKSEDLQHASWSIDGSKSPLSSHAKIESSTFLMLNNVR